MNQRNPRDSCFPWVGSLNGSGEKQVSINRLKELSNDKMYCGADSLNTGPKDPMRSACDQHDADYLQSNVDTTISRKEVDKQFLANMKDIIRVTGKWWLYPQAYIYYGIVRVAGRYFWGPDSKF